MKTTVRLIMTTSGVAAVIGLVLFTMLVPLVVAVIVKHAEEARIDAVAPTYTEPRP